MKMATTAWTDNPAGEKLETTPTDEVRFTYDHWKSTYHWTVQNEHLERDVEIDDEDTLPFVKLALICRLIDERKT